MIETSGSRIGMGASGSGGAGRRAAIVAATFSAIASSSETSASTSSSRNTISGADHSRASASRAAQTSQGSASAWFQLRQLSAGATRVSAICASRAPRRAWIAFSIAARGASAISTGPRRCSSIGRSRSKPSGRAVTTAVAAPTRRQGTSP